MVFLRGQPRGAGTWPREVDEADVLVGVGNAVDVEEAWGDEGAGAGLGGGGAIPDQIDLQAAFLADLAEGGLLGVLVQLDMPAERQPFAEAAMVDEQDLAMLDDEHGDREVDLLVDVRHGWMGAGTRWKAQRPEWEGCLGAVLAMGRCVGEALVRCPARIISRRWILP